MAVVRAERRVTRFRADAPRDLLGAGLFIGWSAPRSATAGKSVRHVKYARGFGPFNSAGNRIRFTEGLRRVVRSYCAAGSGPIIMEPRCCPGFPSSARGVRLGNGRGKSPRRRLPGGSVMASLSYQIGLSSRRLARNSAHLPNHRAADGLLRGYCGPCPSCGVRTVASAMRRVPAGAFARIRPQTPCGRSPSRN